MIKVTISNIWQWSWVSSSVHPLSPYMSSKAENGVTTEGSKDTSAGGSMRESTMGKEQRWPLEAQQPENVCLGSHHTLIVAQRNSFSISDLHTFKRIKSVLLQSQILYFLHQQQKVTWKWWLRIEWCLRGNMLFCCEAFKTCLDKENKHLASNFCSSLSDRVHTLKNTLWVAYLQ